MLKKLRELLADHVLIADGAMGTMLYSNGVFVNSCFDELNLTNPSLVKRIHDDYVAAGVDFIETNTFGANEFKLGRFGLADRLEQINSKGVEIAKSSAASSVLVAGAVGPLGILVEPYGTLMRHEALAAFSRQIKTLCQVGVDFLLLETFTTTEELLIAIEAAASVSDLEIVAQMTVNAFQETAHGQKIEDAISNIAAQNVAAVGLNCSIGPSEMLASIELAANVVDKPLSVQPNAGMPRQIDGRTLYMCTPEYMAEYAKRFYEKGVRIIGGCCGTTPEHIRQIAKAVRALDKAAMATSQNRIIVNLAADCNCVIRKAPAAKSALGQKLATRHKISMIELVPPRGPDLADIFAKARMCAAAGVDAINIPDGPRASSRLSPMVTAAKIQENTGIEAVLHVCCRDRNLIGLQSDMLGAAAMGLNNILAITGDPPKLGEYPDATAVFDLDSIGMTRLIANLNNGIDVGKNRFSPPLELTIGIGVNPASIDLEKEIARFRAKVESGAEYAITQPVFDVACFLRFIEKTADINIPIIAGIWPFTSYKNAEFMANEVPGVVVPQSILSRMSKATAREEGIKIGIEIAREMVSALDDHVAGFAVSAPFGNVATAIKVLGKE